MKKETLLFYSRCLLASLALLGTSIQLIKYGPGMMMYYTVQSNLLVSLFALYMVWAMRQGKDLQSPSFFAHQVSCDHVHHDYLCHLSCYVGSLSYRFLAGWKYALSLHYPALFSLWHPFGGPPAAVSIVDPLRWATLPLLYMAFALFNGLVLKWPIPDAKDSPFAYYFLNVHKYGWSYVLTHAVVIFLAYLLAGYLLYFIKTIKIKAFTSPFAAKAER